MQKLKLFQRNKNFWTPLVIGATLLGSILSSEGMEGERRPFSQQPTRESPSGFWGWVSKLRRPPTEPTQVELHGTEELPPVPENDTIPRVYNPPNDNLKAKFTVLCASYDPQKIDPRFVELAKKHWETIDPPTPDRLTPDQYYERVEAFLTSIPDFTAFSALNGPLDNPLGFDRALALWVDFCPQLEGLEPTLRDMFVRETETFAPSEILKRSTSLKALREYFDFRGSALVIKSVNSTVKQFDYNREFPLTSKVRPILELALTISPWQAKNRSHFVSKIGAPVFIMRMSRDVLDYYMQQLFAMDPYRLQAVEKICLCKGVPEDIDMPSLSRVLDAMNKMTLDQLRALGSVPMKRESYRRGYVLPAFFEGALSLSADEIISRGKAFPERGLDTKDYAGKEYMGWAQVIALKMPAGEIRTIARKLKKHNDERIQNSGGGKDKPPLERLNQEEYATYLLEDVLSDTLRAEFDHLMDEEVNEEFKFWYDYAKKHWRETLKSGDVKAYWESYDKDPKRENLHPIHFFDCVRGFFLNRNQQALTMVKEFCPDVTALEDPINFDKFIQFGCYIFPKITHLDQETRAFIIQEAFKHSAIGMFKVLHILREVNGYFYKANLEVVTLAYTLGYDSIIRLLRHLPSRGLREDPEGICGFCRSGLTEDEQDAIVKLFFSKPDFRLLDITNCSSIWDHFIARKSDGNDPASRLKFVQLLKGASPEMLQIVKSKPLLGAYPLVVLEKILQMTPEEMNTRTQVVEQIIHKWTRGEGESFTEDLRKISKILLDMPYAQFQAILGNWGNFFQSESLLDLLPGDLLPILEAFESLTNDQIFNLSWFFGTREEALVFYNAGLTGLGALYGEILKKAGGFLGNTMEGLNVLEGRVNLILRILPRDLVGKMNHKRIPAICHILTMDAGQLRALSNDLEKLFPEGLSLDERVQRVKDMNLLSPEKFEDRA
ncbi:MAG: hypothetical protein K2Y18_10465 [Alphaproteobacteria bacterium]|nr:hypothetical protein [Alphaproteobacteria bacterium]